MKAEPKFIPVQTSFQWGLTEERLEDAIKYHEIDKGGEIMENHFCDIHGCQMEERDDPRGPHRIGQRTFFCLVCEEEGRYQWSTDATGT